MLACSAPALSVVGKTRKAPQMSNRMGRAKKQNRVNEIVKKTNTRGTHTGQHGCTGHRVRGVHGLMGQPEIPNGRKMLASRGWEGQRGNGMRLGLGSQTMKGGASRVNAVMERGCLKQGGRGRTQRGKRCSSFSPDAVLPLAKVSGRQRAMELGKVAPGD